MVSYGTASSFVRPRAGLFRGMPANEANADQDPDSAKHSCNLIDRRHDCGWRTAFGNMGKDEGDTALGSHAGLDSHALELRSGKLRLQKILGSQKKIAIQGCNNSKPRLK
jgi:hypothetical protein